MQIPMMKIAACGKNDGEVAVGRGPRAGALVLAVCAALVLLGAASGMGDRGPAERNGAFAAVDTTAPVTASEPIETEQGTVQFIGLQSKTPEQMLDTLRAMTPKGNFIMQCITTIERQLGYPDAMVFMQPGSTPYFVVSVVAPEHAGDVQFLEQPSTNPGLPSAWTAALAGEASESGAGAREETSTGPEMSDMHAIALARVVETYGAALQGKPDEALASALRRGRIDSVYVKRAFDFVQARTGVSDLEAALRVARTDADGPDRVAALAVLVNFSGDERAWHALARHVTDPVDAASMTAFRALTVMSNAQPQPVDWRPVAPYLRANLAGTNQVITPFLLDVLRKTNVDPELGAELVAGRPGERLLAHLQTPVQTTTSSIRPFLKHVSGVEGLDAWRTWHGSLGNVE
jgi:hypothetical protein